MGTRCFRPSNLMLASSILLDLAHSSRHVLSLQSIYPLRVRPNYVSHQIDWIGRGAFLSKSKLSLRKATLLLSVESNLSYIIHSNNLPVLFRRHIAMKGEVSPKDLFALGMRISLCFIRSVAPSIRHAVSTSAKLFGVTLNAVLSAFLGMLSMPGVKMERRQSQINLPGCR